MLLMQEKKDKCLAEVTASMDCLLKEAEIDFQLAQSAEQLKKIVQQAITRQYFTTPSNTATNPDPDSDGAMALFARRRGSSVSLESASPKKSPSMSSLPIFASPLSPRRSMSRPNSCKDLSELPTIVEKHRIEESLDEESVNEVVDQEFLMADSILMHDVKAVSQRLTNLTVEVPYPQPLLLSPRSPFNAHRLSTMSSHKDFILKLPESCLGIDLVSIPPEKLTHLAQLIQEKILVKYRAEVEDKAHPLSPRVKVFPFL